MLTSSDIITQARTWLGTSFHHQGRLKKTATSCGGVDCIGLVIGVMQELNLSDVSGKKLADYDNTNYSINPDGYALKAAIEQHLELIDITDIQPGDLLLFRFQRNPQHVGFVSDLPGENLGVIHCYSAIGKVVEHHLTEKWRKLIVVAYRFKPQHLMVER